MSNCEYCGKRTRDMVEHLGKNKKCSQVHAEKLSLQFKEIINEHEKLVKKFKGEAINE